jgi:hypothetical protein
MDHQNKLQKVREKIIEAVPEIMELKFGCRVSGIIAKYTSFPKEIIGTYIGKVPNHELLIADEDNTLRYIYPKDLKILGRDIRLADVLRTLRKIWVEDNLKKSWNDTMSLLILNYNLEKDNLGDQNEETISFLYFIFYPHD